MGCAKGLEEVMSASAHPNSQQPSPCPISHLTFADAGSQRPMYQSRPIGRAHAARVDESPG